MSLKQIIKFFRPKPMFSTKLAEANFSGIPPTDLSWKEAMRKTRNSIIPMTIIRFRTTCPICNSRLIKYNSDYDKELGQHMVWGIYCDKGHWTYIEAA